MTPETDMTDLQSSAPMIEIKCRFTGRVLYAGAHATVAAALIAAVASGANLYGANLSGADLSGADIADHAIAQTRSLPDGAMIGWKKCQGDVLVKLRIPEDAPRSHAFGRKCRAAYAEVLEVIGAEVGVSRHDRKTTYRVGETVRADVWDENWMEECAGGIHFFITRAEAEAW